MSVPCKHKLYAAGITRDWIRAVAEQDGLSAKQCHCTYCRLKAIVAGTSIVQSAQDERPDARRRSASPMVMIPWHGICTKTAVETGKRRDCLGERIAHCCETLLADAPPPRSAPHRV